MPSSVTTIRANLDSLDQVVSALDDILLEDSILFLRGDLASGKTTLVGAIAKYYNIDTTVTSPTFSLQQCYGDRLYHYDLYRIEHEEFMSLGLFEEFEKSGWHLVEWGSDILKKFFESVGYSVTVLEIETDKDERVYRVHN